MDRVCTSSAQNVLNELFERYPALLAVEDSVCSAERILEDAFRGGHKLLVCGNGGSAADSEHIVGELMKSFKFKRDIDPKFAEAYLAENGEEAPAWLEGALPAISLVSQVALSTAFGNDEASVGIFAQQVYGYGVPGDVLLGISTSGNSKNVVLAAKVARAKKMAVITLTGSAVSTLTQLSDECVRVPAQDCFAVQELHLPVYHALCAAVEASLFGNAA